MKHVRFCLYLKKEDEMMEGTRKKWVFAGALLVVALGLVVDAVASPAVNGAVLNLRVFNDDPASIVTSSNNYPSQIWIEDDRTQTGGWANRHNFRLSEDGGATEAVFMNADPFEFSADVKITGTANTEGGLQLSPWWSKEVDGSFMINAGSGEIACFGGRLPFYSFTANQGLLYTKGTTVNQKISYVPQGLSAASPGRIKYTLKMGATTYYSPWLAFDQGNPAEDPPYGLWGDLNDARVGGYFQPQVNIGLPGNWGQIEFTNMSYAPTPEPASLALLGLGALAAIRRRR